MTTYRCPQCGLTFRVEIGNRLRCVADHGNACCHYGEMIRADDGRCYQAVGRPDCVPDVFAGVLG